jgi:hypothetical protein
MKILIIEGASRAVWLRVAMSCIWQAIRHKHGGYLRLHGERFSLKKPEA